MLQRQRGITLSSVMGWIIVIAMVASLGMKVLPSYLEYNSIMSQIEAIVKDMPNGSVQDIRRSFDKRSQINDIKAVTGNDLDVGKDGGALVIGFEYQVKVPLVGFASLLMEYKGEASSAAK